MSDESSMPTAKILRNKKTGKVRIAWYDQDGNEVDAPTIEGPPPDPELQATIVKAAKDALSESDKSAD